VLNLKRFDVILFLLLTCDEKYRRSIIIIIVVVVVVVVLHLFLAVVRLTIFTDRVVWARTQKQIFRGRF